MARVFTITFNFWGEEYVAMVTLSCNTPEQTRFNIRLLENELNDILPEGQISFASTDNSLPEAIQNPVAEELFLCLRKRITEYLLLHAPSQPTPLQNK